jgi:serine/threonine protein kinase
MYALHSLSVAVQQLQAAHVNHNEVKPANFLVFDEVLQKLADLGRATSGALSGPFDTYECAGDRRYAAPELLYRPEFASKSISFDARISSDLYLVGSMLLFFLTRKILTPVLLQNMSLKYPDMMTNRWRGTFGELLPYLRDVFSTGLLDLDKLLEKHQYIYEKHRETLVDAISQLCDPDPAVRGKRAQNAEQGVRPYVAVFNELRERTASYLRSQMQGETVGRARKVLPRCRDLLRTRPSEREPLRPGPEIENRGELFQRYFRAWQRDSSIVNAVEVLDAALLTGERLLTWGPASQLLREANHLALAVVEQAKQLYHWGG